MTRLVLKGPVPSKKNDRSIGYRRGKLTMFIDKDQQAALDALVWQAKAQWKGMARLVHPDISIRFHVSNRRQDRDNMATTLLDVLVKAGVLANDNIAQCNGRITIEPAVLDRVDEPMTFVEVTETCWKE